MPRPRMTEEEFELWNKIKDNDFVKNQVNELEEACDKAGIEVKDVKHYWYKSEHFSIFAKNKVKTYDEVKDDLVAELKEYAPEYPTIVREENNGEYLLVVDPADPHIGKNSVASETGYEYNIDIAVNRVLDGIQGLLNKAQGFPPEKILFIIGNDALHVDGPNNKTTAGTPQDMATQWHVAFQAAKDMYIKSIETLMQKADVHVAYCPSNHDFSQGYLLADTIASWFHKSDNVTFDASINHRKYFKFGCNMIEMDHGDGHKLSKTPMLMATEKPQMWADCPFRYSYKHHYHSRKKNPMTGFDGIGLNVFHLRSPSPADGWHHRNGFLNQPAVEAFVHDKNAGRIANFTHYFKEDLEGRK